MLNFRDFLFENWKAYSESKDEQAFEEYLSMDMKSKDWFKEGDAYGGYVKKYMDAHFDEFKEIKEKIKRESNKPSKKA